MILEPKTASAFPAACCSVAEIPLAGPQGAAMEGLSGRASGGLSVNPALRAALSSRSMSDWPL
jgi:hypothetical protein